MAFAVLKIRTADVDCWWRGCSRDIWRGCRFSTRIIWTWTSTNTIFLKKKLNKNLSPSQQYLRWQWCRWDPDVGDLKLATICWCWRLNFLFKSVTIILSLSLTHFVSNNRRQHRCKYIYLTRAFQLSLTKIIIAISFAVSVSIAAINTATHFQTIFAKASIPVLIGFFFLKESYYMSHRFMSHN